MGQSEAPAVTALPAGPIPGPSSSPASQPGASEPAMGIPTAGYPPPSHATAYRQVLMAPPLGMFGHTYPAPPPPPQPVHVHHVRQANNGFLSSITSAIDGVARDVDRMLGGSTYTTATTYSTGPSTGYWATPGAYYVPPAAPVPHTTWAYAAAPGQATYIIQGQAPFAAPPAMQASGASVSVQQVGVQRHMPAHGQYHAHPSVTSQMEQVQVGYLPPASVYAPAATQPAGCVAAAGPSRTAASGVPSMRVAEKPGKGA